MNCHRTKTETLEEKQEFNSHGNRNQVIRNKKRKKNCETHEYDRKMLQMS